MPIDEVMMGSANQAGEDNRNVARMSALLAKRCMCCNSQDESAQASFKASLASTL